MEAFVWMYYPLIGFAVMHHTTAILLLAGAAHTGAKRVRAPRKN